MGYHREKFFCQDDEVLCETVMRQVIYMIRQQKLRLFSEVPEVIFGKQGYQFYLEKINKKTTCDLFSKNQQTLEK